MKIELKNLKGHKENDLEAVKKASKELFEKFQKANDELKTEMKKELTTEQEEKLKKINDELSNLAKQMKENNEKLDAAEKERQKSLDEKFDKVEKDFAQKLAEARPANPEQGEKEAQKIAIEGIREFMRTGAISKTKELHGEKANFALSGNEFVIPAEIDQMIQRLVSDESEILPIVNVVTTTTRDYRKLINQRGVGVGKAAEATTRAAQTAPTLSEVEPTYGELYTYFGINQHALDDAGFNLEQELIDSVQIDFAEALDADFVSGSGTNTIKGLNTYSAVASPSFGQLKKIVSETAGGTAITYNDMMQVIYGINKRYRRNGSILTSRTGMATIRQIEDTNGNLVMRPSFNEGRFEETWLGYPTKESEEIADLAAGERALYFGDFFRGYLLHFLRGMRMIRDPFTTKGVVLFYISQRVGGGLADSTALDVLQMTTAS